MPDQVDSNADAVLVFPPLWLDLLTYFMVAITVVSGVDYFFGLRRLLREAEDRRPRADVTPENWG